MKKWFSFVGILTSLIILVACAAPSVSISPEEFNGEFTAYCFKHIYVHDKKDQRIEERTALLDSMKKLETFRKQNLIEKLDENYLANNDEVVDKLNSYSKEYFIENILIVIFTASSSSYEYSVESLHLNEETVNVVLHFDSDSPVVTTDRITWGILVECKRVEGIHAVDSTVTWDPVKQGTT